MVAADWGSISRRSSDANAMVFRDAFRLALDLHPADQPPIDMTWGRGGMWKGIGRYQSLRCDGNAELPNLDVVARWRDLPMLLGRQRHELLVADPIHIDDVGRNSTWRRYVLSDDGPAADGTVKELLEQVLTVALELLDPRRGTLLLKIAESNHNDRPQRHGYEVNKLADKLKLHVCGQWTEPSRSMADPKRQTIRHFPSGLHLFILHPFASCPYRGLRLVGRTHCAWCQNPIVVQRVRLTNYCPRPRRCRQNACEARKHERAADRAA
jgi:hypothetical protein